MFCNKPKNGYKCRYCLKVPHKIKLNSNVIELKVKVAKQSHT